MHCSTKAWASGVEVIVFPSPGHDLAWLIHLARTFLIVVCLLVEPAKQDAHRLAGRPPISIAGFRSSPVAALTTVANFTCAFHFLFLILSFTNTSSFSYGGDCSVEANGGGSKYGDGDYCTPTTTSACSAGREKNFKMLIACFALLRFKQGGR